MKLSFDQWKTQIKYDTIPVKEMTALHGIDIEEEMAFILYFEYQNYLKSDEPFDWSSPISYEQSLHMTYRANGDVVCSTCNKPYSAHPFETRILDYNNEPYLNRLCDGTLVKL